MQGLILISYHFYQTFQDANWAKTLYPPFQLTDCLSYFNKDEIEFDNTEFLYFCCLFFAMV